MQRLVFDLETVRSAAEVGGWNNAHLMRLSVAVVYDYRSDGYRVFREYETDDLVRLLAGAAAVIGYNLHGLCYRVLSYYSGYRFDRLNTLDLLEDLRQRHGSRERLDDLAQATLNRVRASRGLDVLQWVRAGDWEEAIAHCRRDVELIKDLYEFGLTHGHLMSYLPGGLVPNKLTVDWR